MPTPFESAQLNLKLYELRREPVLREARTWFLHQFNPETMADLLAAVTPERNAAFRMVLGYWEIAASMVSTGAIDRAAFLAAHGEILATFAKVYPFLPAIRSIVESPEFCLHMEQVLFADPETRSVVEHRREKLLKLARSAPVASQQA